MFDGLQLMTWQFNKIQSTLSDPQVHSTLPNSFFLEHACMLFLCAGMVFKDRILYCFLMSYAKTASHNIAAIFD